MMEQLIQELEKSKRLRELWLKEASSLSTGPPITKSEEVILDTTIPFLLDRIKSLELALHNAIRRPMGVIPASAEPFVTTEGLKAAEDRRKNIEIPKQNQRDR
jgi:hypothetical protein